MAQTLNVLIVHGIGWGGRGTSYSRPLIQNVSTEFDRALKALKLRDVDHSAARSKNALRFETVCWDPVTQQPQDAMISVLFGRPWLSRRLSMTYQFRRNMVGMLGDVTAYERDPNNKVYRAIHEEVDKGVAKLGEAARVQAETAYAPLTIIGHSLGSVIVSDYVWDHTGSAGQSHLLRGHDLSLVNMILMGSPMALYSLRNNAYGGRDSIRDSLGSPVAVDPDYGMWLNLYDRQDPIGFPLEPVESYRDAGVIDSAVNAGNWLTGWNLLSHVGYWHCHETARAIGGKLALDWARLNSPRFAERDYDKHFKAYRKGLRKG
ncbi:hypothetical protein [Aggregatilinea lenta]|uniref:hypothetical protein n=1 Tax=Aggregatilinea lenta TaxID=913108 RepID=UPI000E5A8C16|nr:hypothetical protein [Aggregatilinea lenta]